MTYAELIEGKSVAIIAPAAYLLGSRQRARIESCDLIARINRGFPVPPGMVEDIGERTDILYHLLMVGMAASEQVFKPCIGKVGFIVSTRHEGEPRVPQFKRINRGRIPFECVPFSMIQSVKLRVRKAPNAGVIAVTHLLSMPIKSLYLTGFSFYEDGYYPGYNETAGRIQGGQAGHDQVTSKAYMKALLASTTIPLEMDGAMAQIVGRSKEINEQLLEIHAVKHLDIVKLRATMAQRHGAETIMPGDTMLKTRRDADILIRKGRAVLV
jgi:hypothetical protein